MESAVADKTVMSATADSNPIDASKNSYSKPEELFYRYLIFNIKIDVFFSKFTGER